ncbi:hypothetical protein C0Q70_09726 [Pomacea canaliculata]|uniref:LanC-like protein 2 n=2 Tax=Pomacea canaliculata TaxID=400727 RepID=A0A2T7PAK8_POMCA|nr:hypothetical protein C0Q70_09726 [Pomacea canaliculata]
MSNRREFSNPYPDYHGEKLLDDAGKMDEAFAEKVRCSIQDLMTRLQGGIRQTIKKDDYSIYTGQTGFALLFLQLYEKFGHAEERQHFLETAAVYLKPALKHLKSGVHSFLCGDAGVLAVAAVVHAKLGDSKTSKECVERLESLQEHVCKDRKMPNEHLYGRAGYLAAVMFVQKHLGADSIKKEVIVSVTKAILYSGKTLSQKEKWQHPLMYSWYDQYYLGAAHGLAGIFYTLLLVKEPEVRPHIESLVQPCIDFMLSLRFPSGNYPAVVGDSDDRLVHWCHGAPGWVAMFALAYQTYKKKEYLDAAEECGNVVWKRGLLKKGYGLCHGAAGNAYAFLTLFHLTHDKKYLYRACKFAEWCFDYGKHGCRIPDTPFSMFEGMAGTIYFLVDLLDPMSARFPCFEY